MNARLASEVAAILEQSPEMAEKALELRLAGSSFVPPVKELVDLGARVRESRASGEELQLAVGALLALYAEPTGAFEH